MSFEELKRQVEAILFTTDSLLEAGEIRALLGEVSLSDVRMAIRALAREYEERAFELVEINNRYQIRTKDSYLPVIKKQYASKPRTLSRGALETLSIIAYRQPITKAQINAIRQVDSSFMLQTLRERELIYVSGTKKEAGNPLEYKTTEKFLQVFGLKKISDLPSLRSLQLNLDEQKNIQEALESLKNNEIQEDFPLQEKLESI